MPRLPFLLAAAPLLLLLGAAPAGEPRVTIETPLGRIVIAVDTRHAPVTSTNFLRYVDEHRFDGTSFYRAARNKRAPQFGFVQGGINHNARIARFPIPHEPTSKTGLHHVDGTVSMARNDPGTAAGDFFIIVGDARYLDYRSPEQPGYAAFGHVVAGMDVVKRILARPTYVGGFSMNTLGQSLKPPVPITRAHR